MQLINCTLSADRLRAVCHLQESFRVTHNRDIVPSVPLQLMGFHHVPREVCIAGSMDSGPQPVFTPSATTQPCSWLSP